MFARLVWTFVLSLALVPAAEAWWDSGWGYRKAITLDTTGAGAGLTTATGDVPVLVRLHTGNFTHFLDLTDGGGDLRFVDGDDKTPLKHHVEKLDPVNELAFVWVQVPKLKPDSGPAPLDEDGKTQAGGAPPNKIYMYFGNPKATKAEDAPGTFGAGVAAVYHFGETGGLPQDRSANGNHATAFAGQAVGASLIGPGARFGSGAMTIPDSPSLKMSAAQGFGFSAWLRIDAPQAESHVFDRTDGAQRLTLAIDGTHLYAKYTNGGGVTIETPRWEGVTPGAWHHVALVAGNDQVIVYVDGEPRGQVTTTLNDMGGAIAIGAAADNTHPLGAELDEVRIFDIAPAPEAVKFAARSEGTDAKTVGYLADENSESEGAGEGEAESASYFGIILNQVFGRKEAIVEQSVIGVCVLMALVAFAVMILKQRYLMTCRKATHRFLTAYEHLGIAGEDADLFALSAREKEFHRSPLFRVYKQGVNEIERRLLPAVGSDATALNERSFLAIRAAMDAVMVREGQRLNAQMVLLTIAISGGPFIGLLGTVVGVMVTFAAIAATGDVNINAIAPGMAAALLATTAGLAVAIPALFGYNYLGSRIKELAADMHVFADEFVARLNEVHGG
ncbi:MAG: DUF2341 domain-containing protein [Gammaproteobacteria bacterium]|nr:DUF2341 domain-containing protein [Gammaproteobacteria bacterium]